MLLQVSSLQKTFANGVRAIDGVSFDLRPGEHLGVVGESGCGKTTLARVVMGLTGADGGTMAFDGRPCAINAPRGTDFYRRVRMVFQDPFSSLDPRFSVRDILREALRLEPRLTRGEELSRMRSALEMVQLPADSLTRYPHEFSGGERQRLAIARALMTGPALLILDEAVSSLDVLIQKEIILMLEELARRTGVTYLFISHNLRVVKRFCCHIAVMQGGRIVEYAGREELFRQPRHPYTRALLHAAFNYEVAP